MKRAGKLYLSVLALLCITLMLSSLHIVAQEPLWRPPNGFIYVINNWEAAVYSYEGTDSVITIPDKAQNLPITRIGGWFDVWGENLTSVTIPQRRHQHWGTCIFRLQQSDLHEHFVWDQQFKG